MGHRVGALLVGRGLTGHPALTPHRRGLAPTLPTASGLLPPRPVPWGRRVLRNGHQGRCRRDTGPAWDAKPWAPTMRLVPPLLSPGGQGDQGMGPKQLRPPSSRRAQQDPGSTFSKIYRRSFCLLQAWVEDCQAVDLARNAALVARLEGFISSKVTAGGRRPARSSTAPSGTGGDLCPCPDPAPGWLRGAPAGPPGGGN